MTTPEACPGCGTKLDASMYACPNCPMSFPEDEPPSGVHPLRQTKAYAFLMPALFFASIGAAVWFLGSGLFRLAGENAVMETAPAVRGERAALTSGAEVSVEEPSSGEVAIGPAAPRRKPVKEWRLRGHVYDLATLAPLKGCAMVFSDEKKNLRFKTRTDAGGRYRAVVASLPDRGYSVSIVKKGYSPAYLNPGVEGVPRLSKRRRLELSQELAAALSAPMHSVQAYDAKPLVTDFYLAPRR